jgi:hypothetical protein
MYPHVVQFETRRSEMARELRLSREREAAREGVSKPQVRSVAFESTRLRALLGGDGWSRRKARIARDSR